MKVTCMDCERLAHKLAKTRMELEAALAAVPQYDDKVVQGIYELAMKIQTAAPGTLPEEPSKEAIDAARHELGKYTHSVHVPNMLSAAYAAERQKDE